MTTTSTPRAATRSRHQRLQHRHLLYAGSRLTERDRLICGLLHDHRVLTTAQIHQAAFTGLRRTEERLAVLYDLDVVDRFVRRSGPVTSAYHWTLGPIGAAVVAAERGIDPDEHRWRPDALTGLATSQRLSHLIGTNGIFTSLLATARTNPGTRQLAEWWSERRCATEWGDLVRPDGYGVWTEDDYTLPFLLEYDNGTERLHRLTDKLPGYVELAEFSGHPTWVLFRFPSTRRETNARHALTQAHVPVATAVLHHSDDTAAAMWSPTTGPTDDRYRLIDLGDPAHHCNPPPAEDTTPGWA